MSAEPAPGRPRRWRRLILGLGAALLVWVGVVAGNGLGRYFGWFVPAQTPEALAEALRPFYRQAVPEGPGRFPTALLYSGCDGPADNLDRWAEMLVARGWAAVVVDSHGPRNYGGSDVWRLICAGQLLTGPERAGDVLVSIWDARKMPFVDPDRLVLIGASHGGWAIMELFGFATARRLPFNLSALPEGAGEAPLEGLLGSILLYPYCGAANRARRSGWRLDAPALFLLAENDAIAPHEACLEVAALLEAGGTAVEVRVLPGVTHGFDQERRAPLSLLRFDAAATEEALQIAGAFLDRLPDDGPQAAP